jgi:GAF domain-containing protein
MTLTSQLAGDITPPHDRVPPTPHWPDGDPIAHNAELPDAGELTVDSLVQLLTRARAALTDLDQRATPDEMLDQILHVATRLVLGAEDAGIALAVDGELQTVAAVGDAALAADDIQRALGQGPTHDVLTEQRPLRIPDLSTDPRWVELGPLAAEVGVRAVLACPLPMPRKGLGVLSVYSSRPAAFDAAAELVLPVFAARSAIAVAYADTVTNLHRAIESRQVIGQAVGILMERHRLSPKQAFDRLVTASQHSHVKLRDLAGRISETGEEPSAAADGDR